MLITAAFLAGKGVFTGNGGITNTIADDSGAFVNFGLVPSLNNAGTTAFAAQLANIDDGIHAGTGGPLTTIAGPFSFAADASINDDGTVAFRKTDVGQPGDGSIGILTGNGGSLAPIADDMGALKQFGAPSLNNEGELVFIATLDAGGAGIFTGPDILTDSVVLTGDLLDGSTITSLAMHINAFNAAGQVAFWAELSDGNEGIYLSSPVPLPPIFYLFTSGLIGLIGMARRKAA